MALHFLSARTLVEELAAGRVSAREQATYLAASFWIWVVPAYLHIARTSVSPDYPFYLVYWFAEFAMLLVFNAAGVFHCFNQCRVNPERHFMIDFGCLYAPVSLAVLAVTWGSFHAILWAVHAFVPDLLPLDAPPLDPRGHGYAYARFHDLLRYLVVVGQVALIYWFVGRHMRRASDLRA